MVYVLNIDHEGIADSDKIDEFAEQLLMLRLAQLKLYEGEKRSRDNEPRCTRPAAGSSNALRVTIGSDANHYVIKTTITVRSSSEGFREALLEYELKKCRIDGTVILLAQNKNLFGYAEVLNHLNSMADGIAFLLEQEQQVTKINVDFKGITSMPQWLRVGDAVLERLMEAQEFEPRVVTAGTPQGSPAEYTLGGRVYSENSKLWLEVEVKNRRDRVFMKRFAGPLETDLSDVKKREAFIKEKSLEALDYLTFIRNVADTDQPKPLTDVEAQESLKQARELLCKADVAPGCLSQASPAADLLAQVVKNKRFDQSANWELFAIALKQAGENKRAGEAFEMAAGRAKDEGNTSVAADLLSQSGSAWLEGQNFVAARSVFEKLITLSPKRPDAYLGKAKSYRYAGERLTALEFLLDSMIALPESKDLNDELALLIGNMSEEELEPARTAIERREKGKEKLAAAPVLLQSRRAELIALKVGSLYENADYDSMDAELKKLEALSDLIAGSSDEAVATVGLRGLWFREAKGDFDSALRLLKLAKFKLKSRPGLDEDDYDEVDRELAITLLKRAQAQVDKSEARKDVEEASLILTESIKTTNDSSTLTLLRKVNHELGKDRETLSLLQHRGDERRATVDDYLSIGMICNSYLRDPECGLKTSAALKGSMHYGAASYASLLQAESLMIKNDLEQAFSAQQESLKLGALSLETRPVAQFYGILFQMVKDHNANTGELLNAWRGSMREVREFPKEIDWVFDGALRFLESDQSIPINKKMFLREMIAAMQDSKKPVPSALPAP